MRRPRAMPLIFGVMAACGPATKTPPAATPVSVGADATPKQEPERTVAFRAECKSALACLNTLAALTGKDEAIRGPNGIFSALTDQSQFALLGVSDGQDVSWVGGVGLGAAFDTFVASSPELQPEGGGLFVDAEADRFYLNDAGVVWIGNDTDDLVFAATQPLSDGVEDPKVLIHGTLHPQLVPAATRGEWSSSREDSQLRDWLEQSAELGFKVAQLNDGKRMELEMTARPRPETDLMRTLEAAMASRPGRLTDVLDPAGGLYMYWNYATSVRPSDAANLTEATEDMRRALSHDELKDVDGTSDLMAAMEQLAAEVAASPHLEGVMGLVPQGRVQSVALVFGGLSSKTWRQASDAVVRITHDPKVVKNGELLPVSAAPLRGGGTRYWVDLPADKGPYDAPTSLTWTTNEEALIMLFGPTAGLARSLTKLQRRVDKAPDRPSTHALALQIDAAPLAKSFAGLPTALSAMLSTLKGDAGRVDMTFDAVDGQYVIRASVDRQLVATIRTLMAFGG